MTIPQTDSTASSGFSGSQIVENSYFVTFKEPVEGTEPIIMEKPKGVTQTNDISFSAGTWDEKQKIATKLGTHGEVMAIYSTINTVLIQMDEKEASRLTQDKRVLGVYQNIITSPQTSSPGWGLDRMDEQTPALDHNYSPYNTGVGRTIYILDTGLDLSNPKVAAEFGGRASVLYDVNGQGGKDCHGHGTQVASAAAGKTYGVAKGAKVVVGKITTDCTGSAFISTSILAFNWLAENAPPGSIVNWSNALTNQSGPRCAPRFHPPLEAAIKKAHDAGIIVVVAAGNDACNTKDFSPTNIPESFVVGATSRWGFPHKDHKAAFSRTGTNISAFAPGQSVSLMNNVGNEVTKNGTSFSAPYISGLFAVACQAAGTLCNSGNTAYLYNALRNTGTLNTVTDPDGTPLTGATSRFLSHQW